MGAERTPLALSEELLTAMRSRTILSHSIFKNHLGLDLCEKPGGRLVVYKPIPERTDSFINDPERIHLQESVNEIREELLHRNIIDRGGAWFEDELYTASVDRSRRNSNKKNRENRLSLIHRGRNVDIEIFFGFNKDFQLTVGFYDGRTQKHQFGTKRIPVKKMVYDEYVIIEDVLARFATHIGAPIPEVDFLLINPHLIDLGIKDDKR